MSFIYLLLVNLFFCRVDTRSSLKQEVGRDGEVVLFRQGTCEGRLYLLFCPPDPGLHVALWKMAGRNEQWLSVKSSIPLTAGAS